ncbi:cation channel family transporter (macronuclear) [Tetrahymena thermophila SB210]|uniref:Cation channel family transporter n=1 Tax=Tetrahymena thermophila (strain SB210) TaxID=312017 RepID=I7LXV2_TETTS|nr:cation channel family transporter [Tetrahymena thermophila SB210]EAS06251.3 cation channel family transporter [Tetrahymena thermophila SB210]|eukprot:XP_001026496.3 cation channel family transporter [Tetrahymena thermophila SB210]
MADLLKQIEQVYPELNVPNKIKNASVKKFLVRFNEAFNVAIILTLFFTFMALPDGSQTERFIFRSINEISSILISIMSILNLIHLKHLYFDSKYYGAPFVLIDFLSGVFCIFLDIISLIVGKNMLGIYYADGFRMLKLFTFEKLRIIIKDIFYVMPKAKKVFFSMVFVFFVFSLIGFKLFHHVNAEQFRNLFVSLLSMFQVLTFDSWNVQMNIPIINKWGGHWSIFFIIAIFLLQFFYFNFFLSEFVTYYSNRNYRVNFVYKYNQDEIHNHKLKEWSKRYLSVNEVLKVLKIEKSEKDLSLIDFILANYKYLYIFAILFIELLRVFFNPLLFVYILEVIVGLLAIIEFSLIIEQLQLKEKKSINGDKSTLQQICQSSKLVFLFLAGFVGFAVDLISMIYGNYTLNYGSCFRILVLLTTYECQFSFIKLSQVFSKIGEMGFVNLAIMYTLAIIGYYCLYRFDVTFGFYFEDVTNTYMYLLQTITFDAWGDIARAAMLMNPVYAIYFAFMIIFMGFLLQNFMVGTIATTVQPACEDEFNQSRVLQRKISQYQVNILRESLGNSQQFNQNSQNLKKDQESTENLKKLKEIIEEFNKGQGNLTVTFEGKSYDLKSKNIISLQN